MKILIAYAGKSGVTEQAARELAGKLTAFDVTLADLAAETPDPSLFDYIILGGAVRYRKIHRAARDFAKKHRDVLQKKPHTLFVVCAYDMFFEQYAEWSFGRALCDGAERLVYFGGELDPAAERGFARLVVRRMRNEIKESEDKDAHLPSYLPEHVRLLADYLRDKYAGDSAKK